MKPLAVHGPRSMRGQRFQKKQVQQPWEATDITIVHGVVDTVEPSRLANGREKGNVGGKTNTGTTAGRERKRGRENAMLLWLESVLT